MRDINMLVWLMQLGLSVALPLAGGAWLGVWLRDRFSLGAWVIVCGVVLGMILAADGLHTSLKMMQKQAKPRKGEEKPPVSFNDHD